MKASAEPSRLLVIGVLWVALTLPAWAGYIYNNSMNDSVIRFDAGLFEVGDQIVFAGAERNLTYFDFEYWGSKLGEPNATSFAGSVEARIRFYLNDGTLFNGYGIPGYKFYDSGWFGGFGPTDCWPYRATIYLTEGVDFPAGGLAIPGDEITWSVQFRGMVEGTDTVGVDLYSPPSIGGHYDDYWRNLGDELTPDWRLITNGMPMDFGARFYAVPEPSCLGLSLAGGLGILALLRRLRRTS